MEKKIIYRFILGVLIGIISFKICEYFPLHNTLKGEYTKFFNYNVVNVMAFNDNILNVIIFMCVLISDIIRAIHLKIKNFFWYTISTLSGQLFIRFLIFILGMMLLSAL